MMSFNTPVFCIPAAKCNNVGGAATSATILECGRTLRIRCATSWMVPVELLPLLPTFLKIGVEAAGPKSFRATLERPHQGTTKRWPLMQRLFSLDDGGVSELLESATMRRVGYRTIEAESPISYACKSTP